MAERADRHDDGRCLALLFLDVDRFKTVNDSPGHGTGDELLCAAERLGTTLRPIDTLARLGGDEFTVPLPDIASEKRPPSPPDSRTRSEPIDINGTTFRPTVSIGVVETRTPLSRPTCCGGPTPPCTRPRRAGRNRAAIFDERMRAEVSERNELDRDLTGAVDRKRVRPALPARGRAGDGAAAGCEALVRWRHPDRGRCRGPLHLLGRGERDDRRPGRWVLLDARRTVVGWRTAGLVADDFILRVNLSARQLDQAGLARDVADVLSTVGSTVAPVPEVTETALMRDVRAGMAA